MVAAEAGIRWASASLESSRRGGHFGYRHAPTRAMDMPSAVPICSDGIRARAVWLSTSGSAVPAASCSLRLATPTFKSPHMSAHMSTQMPTHMSAHIYTDMCVDVSLGMCADVCTRHACRHLCRNVCSHVHQNVCRHARQHSLQTVLDVRVRHRAMWRSKARGREC